MQRTTLLKPKLKYSTRNVKRKCKANKNGGKKLKSIR